MPSQSVDVVPYPVDWDNIEEFKKFASYVKAVRNRLSFEKKITSLIKWGGDWNTFKDYPHWEIVEEI
jgi:peptidoglycan L-alanyl-D-glutamate endopeptidase CwlK